MQLLPGPDTTVYALAFAPDGSRLAAAGKDGRAWELDPYGGFRTAHLPAPATCLTYAAGGDLLVGHAAGFAKLDPERFVPGAPMRATSAPTTGLAFLTEKLLAVGTGDRVKPVGGLLMLWDVASGKLRAGALAEPAGVKGVSAAAGRVAWANGSRRVTVWDIAKPDPVHFSLKHVSPGAALSPDGVRVLAGQEWGVAVFDADTRRELWSRREHKGTVSAVAYSPDGHWLASAGRDGSVVLYSPDGRLGRTFAFPGKCYAVAFAPDGLRIAAGGDGGLAVVWDLD